MKDFFLYLLCRLFFNLSGCFLDIGKFLNNIGSKIINIRDKDISL